MLCTMLVQRRERAAKCQGKPRRSNSFGFGPAANRPLGGLAQPQITGPVAARSITAQSSQSVGKAKVKSESSLSRHKTAFLLEISLQIDPVFKLIAIFWVQI